MYFLGLACKYLLSKTGSYFGRGAGQDPWAWGVEWAERNTTGEPPTPQARSRQGGRPTGKL